MIESITIEEYLRGMVGFDVPDSTLSVIRINRHISKGSDINALDQKTKDLSFADLLMWASTNPSSYTGEKQSDGGWTQTGASKTLTASDKRAYRDQAMEIYKQYNDPRYSSKIKIINLYGRRQS